MAATGSQETQILKVKEAAKRKPTDGDVVEATPSKTPGEVAEMPDEQAEEPNKSGKNKHRKKNAEEVESERKNGCSSERDRKHVDKLEVVEDNGKKTTAASKVAEKANDEEVSGVKLYEVQGLQKEGSGEKTISGFELINSEIVDGRKEQEITVEMDTDNGKPMEKKKLKEKKLRRDDEKMKIDQGISERDRVEMGQDGSKEISHIVESKRENQEKRGKKRKNKNGQKEEGANKRSGEGQMVNGEKWAESKEMEGETNANKKGTTHSYKEINNFVEMNTDSEKSTRKNMQRSREFFQRCKEKKMQRKAEKMKIEQGISEIDKMEMRQEGAKENLHKVENNRENENKIGKKRKNRQKEEEANKSSGEGQMVNGGKWGDSKGMEGETNAKKQQTTYTNKEINTFVDMSTDNEKPTGKKLKTSSECFQRFTEKKVPRDAQKMKIDQGISETDKVEMGQEGAKENSNIVDSKRRNEETSGKRRKNQKKELGEGANKSSGEGQMVNREEGTESKGRVGEMYAKKQQTTYTNKEINNFVEMNTNGKPMGKKRKEKKWRINAENKEK